MTDYTLSMWELRARLIVGCAREAWGEAYTYEDLLDAAKRVDKWLNQQQRPIRPLRAVTMVGGWS